MTWPMSTYSASVQQSNQYGPYSSQSDYSDGAAPPIVANVEDDSTVFRAAREKASAEQPVTEHKHGNLAVSKVPAAKVDVQTKPEAPREAVAGIDLNKYWLERNAAQDKKFENEPNYVANMPDGRVWGVQQGMQAGTPEDRGE